MRATATRSHEQKRDGRARPRAHAHSHRRAPTHTLALSHPSTPPHLAPLRIPPQFANMTWDLADLASSERHYRLAKQRFEDDGREVVDITPGGRLNVFRKADYTAFLRGEVP